MRVLRRWDVAFVAALLSCAQSTSPPRDEIVTRSTPAPKMDGGPLPERADPLESRLTNVAFHTGSAGPRLIARGVDRAKAVEMLHLEFLDESGGRVALDADEDGTVDESAVDVFVTERAQGGEFFVEVQSAAGFGRFARQAIVSFFGGMAPKGARYVAPLMPLPVRHAGEDCDPFGFDACEPKTTCFPGIVGETNRCRPTEDARGDRCADAPRLTIANGATLSLEATGTSLWDPPESCASAERNQRPEALAWIHVPTFTETLTLSTEPIDAPAIDTVLMVLPSCALGEPLACNDDAPPPMSRLTLEKVEPGDYLVVVDTLGRRGGTARLRATTR